MPVQANKSQIWFSRQTLILSALHQTYSKFEMFTLNSRTVSHIFAAAIAATSTDYRDTDRYSSARRRSVLAAIQWRITTTTATRTTTRLFTSGKCEHRNLVYAEYRICFVNVNSFITSQLNFRFLGARQSIFAATTATTAIGWANWWRRRWLSEIAPTKAIEIFEPRTQFPHTEIQSVAHCGEQLTMSWRTWRLFSGEYRCTKFHWKSANHRCGYNRSTVPIQCDRCQIDFTSCHWRFSTMWHCAV